MHLWKCIYTQHYLQNDSMFATNITSFNRADVYELNKSATSGNHILSVIGLSLAGILVVGSLALAIACNCPQVYVHNNSGYEFTSGLYSGAVYSTLERTDYLPLNTIPFNAKEIALKISNAKDEQQFINKVELLQITHSQNSRILIDRHGRILSYQKLQAPAFATTNGENNITNVLSNRDHHFYSFTNIANDKGLSDIRLIFDKPVDTKTAKFVIHARNTFWGGLIHKDFLSLFGEGFYKWREKQEKADPKELEKWQTDQALPLMVYLKTSEGWKFIDYYQLIGNTASRDMIMKINTQNIKGNKIELKLQTAYRFWDLDFAGMDYSEDESFTTNIIEPEEELLSGTDKKEALMNNDKAYAILTGDEFISLKYSVSPAIKNNNVSYFLGCTGYYHTLEQYTGKPNYAELYKFQKKGAFDKFSRDKYNEAEKILAVMKSYNNK